MLLLQEYRMPLKLACFILIFFYLIIIKIQNRARIHNGERWQHLFIVFNSYLNSINSTQMVHPIAKTLVLMICLLLANSQNLLTNGVTCPDYLKTKLTNLVDGGSTNVLDMLKVIDGARTPEDVLRGLSVYDPSVITHFLTLSQALSETSKDYQSLSPSIQDKCNSMFTADICVDTCVNIPVLAQTIASPKPQVKICDPNIDVCTNYDINQEDQCKIQLKPLKVRPPTQELLLDVVAWNEGDLCLQELNGFSQLYCVESNAKNFKKKKDGRSPIMEASYRQSLALKPFRTQLQAAYLYSYSKFAHQVGQLSLACNPFVNTGPITDEEIKLILNLP